MLDEAMGLQDKEIARQVRRYIDAIHLRRITRPEEVVSWPVSGGTNHVPDPLLHPGQRATYPHSLFRRTVAALVFRHQRTECSDIIWRELELRLGAACICTAHEDSVLFRQPGCISRIVLINGEPLVRAAWCEHQNPDRCEPICSADWGINHSSRLIVGPTSAEARFAAARHV